MGKQEARTGSRGVFCPEGHVYLVCDGCGFFYGDIRLYPGVTVDCPECHSEVAWACQRLDAALEHQAQARERRTFTTGTELIAAERQRQVEVEGWTPGHDDEHDAGELALAAATYAIPHEGRDAVVWATNRAGTQLTKLTIRRILWPLAWSMRDFKPTPNDRVRELVKAGALIAAEIDRLQRQLAFLRVISRG